MNRKELNQKDRELAKQEEKLKVLKTMAEYDGRDKVITAEQAKKLLEEEERQLYKSSIPTLDNLLEGFETGDLVVISAPTKHGKTSLCQTLTQNFEDDDVKTLWFSYELQRRSFLNNFGEDIPNFTLPQELSDSSTEWLEQRIVEAKAKYGVKIVFIDHLHYLLSLDQAAGTNVSLLIGGIMRELKKLAVKWDVVIFLIAHMKKTSFDGEEIKMSDVRDSSFISQESDVTLLMRRLKDAEMENFTNKTKLKVAANRRTGKTGIVPLIYHDNKFHEYTEDYDK